MWSTAFCFRHMFLLFARSSQSHATSCLSLMSHHAVNNKYNRVKERHWRWLIYALYGFLWCNNVLDLLSFYGEQLYRFSESDLRKSGKKHSFHNKHIYIYGPQTFWSFAKFYFVYIAKVCFVFKIQLYAHITSYMHKTLPTLGN